MNKAILIAAAMAACVASALAQPMPGAPQDHGLTPQSETVYVNRQTTNVFTINNNNTESLGVAIASNGNVIVGWEDDADEEVIEYLGAVWTMFSPTGGSITPPRTITAVQLPGESLTNNFLSYFRADGSAVFGGTSWGPKIKANLFGDGVGLGATSYGLGEEVSELEAFAGTGDFPSVQLLSGTGQPLKIVTGVSSAYAARGGDIRIGDWAYLANGNIVIVGESRQRADLIEIYEGESEETHAIFRLVDPSGNVVKSETLVGETPTRAEIWHGVGVTQDGFAVRFGTPEGGMVRMFDNSGNPTTGNLNLATLTDHPEAGGGGRGDSTGFHGNGRDAYVVANVSGTEVWVTVLSTNGTVRYSRSVSDDPNLTPGGRADAAIDQDGNVIVVFAGRVDEEAPNVILGRRFNAMGEPVGEIFYVSEKELPGEAPGAAQNPRVSWRDGQAAVVWESRSDLETVDPEADPESPAPTKRVVALRVFSTAVVEHQDVTRPGDPIFSSHPPERSPANEQVANAIDNDPMTKYLNFGEGTGTSAPFEGPVGLTVMPSAGPSILSGLALTSANDAPERDPASYILEGSNDGTSFVLISEGPVPVFTERFMRQEVPFTNAAFQVILSGAAERPNQVTTPASGSGFLTVSGNQVTYNIEYTGLTVAATAGHIHGPASIEEAAGVMVPFPDVTGTAGTLTGTLTLDETQLAALRDGLTYVNLHTETSPGGEIRGQIVPASFTTYRLTFPTVVNPATANSLQIAEVELLGTVVRPPRIGLNFGADEPNGSNQARLAGGAVAGVSGVAQANWNNLTGPNGTNMTIVADLDGIPEVTPVTVTWTSNGTWSSTGRGEENNAFPTNSTDWALMTGYLDTGNATTSRVTVANIPAQLTQQGYDLYVYAQGGVGGRGGSYRLLDAAGVPLRDYIRGQSGTNLAEYLEVPRNLGAPDPSGARRFGVGNYLVFRGLTASTVTLEAVTGAAAQGLGFGGTPRAPINAVQLVAPTTGSLMQDVTRPGDPIVSSHPPERSPANEQVANAIDNNSGTKYLNFGEGTDTSAPFEGPVGLTVTPSAGPSILSGLALTSANDAPERDPASFILEGSTDGTTFVLIAEGSVPPFGGRFIRQEIPFNNGAFQAILSGAAERPAPVTTPASGSGFLSLSGDQLTYTIDYTGLTVAATAGHIHGPATTEQAAGVMVPFPNVTGTAGALTGTLTLNEAQISALRGGLTYVNIHTETNPGGEIRGQIVPASFTTYRLTFPTVVNPATANSMQIAEVELLGTVLETAPPPSDISISLVAGQITITYEGTLHSATDVNGPFTPVEGATSPYTVTPEGEARFFIVR